MNILGIDLGGTNVRAGLIEEGHLTRVKATALRSTGTEREILDQIHDLIGEFAHAGVAGIGVGVPSIVDVERGVVYDVQNIPSWKEVPLKEHLEARYGVPVYVNNDANCFAAGEKFFGKGKPYQNIVGLILGTGLGAGLIVNGRLYAGSNCGAGEFGMIPWNDGILEQYCSGQFFQRTRKRSGEQLFHDAVRGDPHALDAFAEFGRNLGRALTIVMLAIDPQIILLGGSVSRSFSLFQEGMRASLASFPYRRTLSRILIEESQLENAAILGAAALFYDAMT